MKKFELWLDESGDFEHDMNKSNRGAHPSLVGGLLIENNSFPDTYINYILPESGTYHSVNENDQIERFKLIEEKLFRNDHNRLIVFSNQECIMILDNNITYLNIISEGILQLIKRLKAEYGDIYLKVLIANRVDTTTGLPPGNSVVASNEYIKRLREKLLLGGLEETISENEWHLENASARRDKRLMLADIICNTFFTRYKRKKFSEEEREYIEGIYNDNKKTIIFTVFESVLEKTFKNNLIENKIGEAVANICLSRDSVLLERCFSLLRANYSACGIHDIVFQYRFIEAYIEYYINVVRDFDLCILFLKNLLYYFVPLLSEYGATQSADYAKRLGVDIKFYMLTVYTHLGNISDAEAIEEECDDDIKALPVSLQTVDYRIRYDVRKVNGLINAFDYSRALAKADELVDKCREIKELLSVISDGEDVFYEELGKALGTRLQIKTFMLRFDKGLYESAKNDSNEAISNFPIYEDKKRQFIYRVQMETEYGNYEEALKYLKLSLDIREEASVKDIWERTNAQSIFSVAAYVRLMAEGARNQWKYSEDMFEQMNKGNYIERYALRERFYHPDEIIFWKYATYCSLKGMGNASVKNYERAVNCCFNADDITLNMIGLAIDFEFHAYLLEQGKSEINSHLKSMQKRWNKVKEQDVHGILKNLFGDVDFQIKDYDYYMNASRKVSY
ncbi:MAG: hypothetical protein IJ794_13315 [Lachnospiraceae bacterium]|nr:hypothetical protein [Lachnospiraceae bacterium]